jgi:hypothetical protein
MNNNVDQYPNWFKLGGAEENFSKYLTQYSGNKLNFLQIGAYTGDATRWLLDNVLTNLESTLTDVDTWEGSDEPAHLELNWKSVEEVYDLRYFEVIKSKKLIKKKINNYMLN